MLNIHSSLDLENMNCTNICCHKSINTYKTIQRQILARIEAEILYNAKVCVNYTKLQTLSVSRDLA